LFRGWILELKAEERRVPASWKVPTEPVLGAINMLSIDELANGRTFILELKDSSGIPIQWVQTLRGIIAKRWYDIYRQSDWVALRLEGASVFLNRVTDAEAERSRKSGRCIVIKTDAVKENELIQPREDPKAR
jgi:hypothetical protein